MKNEQMIFALHKTRDKILSLFSINSYINANLNAEKFNIALEKVKKDIFLLMSEQIIKKNNPKDTISNIALGIQQIKYEIVDLNVEEKWLDVLISIISNAEILVEEYFKKELEKEQTTNKLFSIKKIASLKEKVVETVKKASIKNSKELLHKNLAEDNIKRMLNDFNLASFHVMDGINWENIYIGTQILYKEITTSMRIVGLPSKNLGCYKNLNIIISESLLSEQDWFGFQSKTNASFSIFINPYSKDLNLTWIHEYTHFLDRLAAHSFYLENSCEHHVSTFSHLALDYVTSGETIWNKPLKIMAEAMSAIIGGVNSESFYIKINESINNLRTSLATDFIFNVLPNGKADWNILTEPERQLILWRSKLPQIINFAMFEASSHPQALFALNEDEFLCSVEGDRKINSLINIDDIVDSISDKTQKIDKKELKDKLLPYMHIGFSKTIRRVMNSNNLIVYKDYEIYSDKFFLSLGNDLSLHLHEKQMNADLKFSYYDKPLEMLARLTESLLDKLTTNDSNITFNKKIVLNKKERYLVCMTLQSMARYVGIDVPNLKSEEIPCLRLDYDNNALKETSEIMNIPFSIVIPNETVQEDIIMNISKIKEDFFNEAIVPNKRRLI